MSTITDQPQSFIALACNHFLACWDKVGLDGSLCIKTVHLWQTNRDIKGLFSRTSQRHKCKSNLDFNEARDDDMAVASAGPYANHLHLAPYR